MFCFLLFLGIVAPTRRPKLPFPGNNTQITYTLMLKLHSTFNMQDINKKVLMFPGKFRGYKELLEVRQIKTSNFQV